MKLLSSAFLLILITPVSFGANIWCEGLISDMYIDSSNNLIIKGDWRNEYTRICKTDGSGGIQTVTCSLWFSMAASSITNNKSVSLLYDDQGGTMSCGNIPSYSNAPNPYYVRLIK